MDKKLENFVKALELPVCQDRETVRVVTIRLPVSLHEALHDKARLLSMVLHQPVSMNRLAIEILRGNCSLIEDEQNV